MHVGRIVFAQLIDHIPPYEFTKCVERYDGNHKFRGFSCLVEIILGPAEHDRLLAWSSHLPQLASTALASVLSEQAGGVRDVVGPGLLDTTRLAMSSFDLWRDIPETNEAAVSVALDAYIEKLQRLRNDLGKEFAQAGEFARSLRAQQ